MKRGLLLTAPISVTKSSISSQGGLDPLAIRFALLYLDELCIPQTKFFGVSLPDELKVLEQEKILKTVMSDYLHSGFTDVSHIMSTSYKQCFDILSESKHETWMLHKSVANVLGYNSELTQNGELLTFVNSLPLPGADFPLGDLLDFRIKRNDERLALLNAIESLRINVITDENKEISIKRELLSIEKAIIDLTRVLNETKKGVYLTDLSVDFSSQSFFKIFKDIYHESQDIGLDKLSSLISALGISVASTFNVKGGYSYKKSLPDSPFLYAAQVKEKFKI
ncbi:TPA: DUF6236 family protein [Klebsiella pneumoniae]|nr:hypothetical protein [Klebsiella pneumoniae]HBY9951352.1 hypothetical protein [Klebsiella pneumoniae]